MAVRVAINGFGRIGRNILRAIVEGDRDNEIEVVAVNDLGPVETNAHLLRYDSVHGRFPYEVKVTGDTIETDKQKFKVTAVKDPSQLPHKDLGVDIVLECTGIFTVEGEGLGPPHRRRQEGDHLGPRRRRRPDRRLRHQPPAAEQGARRHLERLVHHQLPRADGQGDERPRRHREGNDDHHPFLHRRPADARYDAQGPLPRPRRRAVADPDLDRRRQGHRPRDARAQGQARRHLDPRADPERVAHRPQVRRQAQRPRCRKSTTR